MHDRELGRAAWSYLGDVCPSDNPRSAAFDFP